MTTRSTLLFAFALLAAGCASVETTDEVRDEREYQTGSRLAKKQYTPSGARIYTPDASDNTYRPVPGPVLRGSGG